MTDHDEKPVTRRECELCPVHTEISNMKGWIKSIDVKFWAVIIAVITDIVTRHL